MAHISHIPASFAPARFFANVMHSVYKSIDNFSAAQSRAKELETLSAMSDEQLAKLGLERSQIVQFVFRDIMYV